MGDHVAFRIISDVFEVSHCRRLQGRRTVRDLGGNTNKVLCYKSEGRWFDPSWCQWIFH